MFRFAHIAILAKDLATVEKFYQTIFGMWTVWKGDNKAYLTTGNGDIFAILQKSDHLPSQCQLASIISANVFPHFGVIVDANHDFDALLTKCQSMNVEVAGPKTSRDGTRSFYCLDPEGNAVQVVQPPSGYFDRKQ
jgi:catechol-2,3-dioxygenase